MKLNKLLNIEYPLIQGGMANIATGEFAASVSNAGALGLIGAGGMDTATLKKNIEICRNLTDKPFGVNIMLINPCADEMAQLVIDEKVPVVTTGAGNPGKYVAAWKAAGIKVLPVVPSVALAKRLEKYNVDAIIVEGTEAGGHIGELTTMALVPQVVEAVSVPVIAAGGIGDGRGIAASFMLGAVGVQMGTRFLVSNECNVHKNYKEKVLKAKDIETEVTGTSTSHPVRVLRNKLTREYIKIEKSNSNSEKLESLTRGALRKAVIEGDTENGSVMAGQIAGIVKKQQSCQEIIEELILEFNKSMKKGLDIDM